MRLETFFDNFALLADAPNGVAKLRELILQLAFRGKVVPQLSDEGTGSSLVEKIQCVKSRLQREGELSKQNSLPSLDEDEKQHEIPTTWQWVRLGEIAAYDGSQKVAPKQIPDNAW